EHAIPIELPIGAIVGSDEMNPACGSEVTAGDCEGGFLGGRGSGAIIVTGGADRVGRTGTFDTQEDFACIRDGAGQTLAGEIAESLGTMRNDARSCRLRGGRFYPCFQRDLG